MKTIRDRGSTSFFYYVCIIMIWCTSVYSSIIQSKYYEIPNGMIIFGTSILLFYVLFNWGSPFDFRDLITEENICMFFFMAYMLLVGLLFSPDPNSHISQWTTCIEYLCIQTIISSIIKKTGTETFHMLFWIEAIALAIILIKEPVDYYHSGRYTIAYDVNPNGLAMGFAAGIWAILYWQQRRKIPLLLASILVALYGYCILLTGSRKALIATGLILSLWLLFCYLPSLKEKRLISGMIAGLSLIALFYFFGREFVQLYSDSKIADRMALLATETTDGNRSDMYRNGFELLKTHPLFGIGFQGYKYYHGEYSHATLVEIPVSGGIIGTLLYFSAYYVSIKKALFIYNRTKGVQEHCNENKKIKMIIILLCVMVFYTICIIHPYQFDSCILFGIIFGELSYLERSLIPSQDTIKMKRESRYFKYE